MMFTTMNENGAPEAPVLVGGGLRAATHRPEEPVLVRIQTSAASFRAA